MKNREKYAEEILDIACSGKSIAVIKESERIVPCDKINNCNKCLFSYNACKEMIREWAESEYIEQVKISKRDKAFLDYIGKNFLYIARDMNGEMCVYKDKPYKMIDCWDIDFFEGMDKLTALKINLPMVKWSDAEPWKIEDLKALEVCDEY